MPDVPFATEIVREMKSKPYSMIVLLALACAVPYLWFNDAKAEDVQQQAQVTNSHLKSIDVTVLQLRLQQISGQLFDVKARIADKQAAHQTVDQIYYDKAGELETLKAAIERQLAALGQ